MRNRITALCVLSLMSLALASGCAKSEAPGPERPPAAPGPAPGAASSPASGATPAHAPGATPSPAPGAAPAPAAGPGTAAAPGPAANAPAPAPGAAVAEGKELFERKCGVCHGLARAADRRAMREEWAGIVKEMQEKKAGWISDAEAAKILDFLVAEHGR